MRVLIASALVAATMAKEDMTHAFLKWATKHGKEYKSLAEFEFRLIQFIRTHSEIAKFNHSNGTSTVGHNKFSDWTEEEWKAFLNYKPRILENDLIADDVAVQDLPTEVNWVDKGAVNPV